MALTSKLWAPSASDVYSCGEVQALHDPASMRHSKEAMPEPASSLPVKVKLAVVLLASAAGLVPIVVSGVPVSLLSVVVAVPRLPAASVRQRRRVFTPSASCAAVTLETRVAGWSNRRLS